MSNSIVATVYSGVIRDVIENVKKDFDENGVNHTVLAELEQLWENKIRSAKVAPWEANGLSGEDHNQNNQNINGGPYLQQPLQAMQTMQSSMQQSMQQSMQTPMQQSLQPPMQSSSDPSLNYQQSRDSPAAASLPARAVNISMHTNHNNEAGRPQPNIKNGNGNPLPPAQPPQTPAFPVSSDISNMSTPINSQVEVDQKIFQHHPHQNFHTLMGQQQDEYGIPMGEKLLPRDTSNNSSPLPEFNTSFADNDDINSDLDDPDDDDVNADSEETQNIILCLYDKVTRTKNKWKCQLKDGIMSVNGRDYLFQKGNGDFEF